MESVYLGVAAVSLVLAAVSLVVCVVVFFRLRVLDAIRFLRHKPVRRVSSKDRRSAAVPKKARQKAGPAASMSDGSRSKAAMSEPSAAGDARDASERPTDLVERSDVAECPTELCAGSDAESPTAVAFDLEEAPLPHARFAADASGEDSGSETVLAPAAERSESLTELLSCEGDSESQATLLSKAVGSDEDRGDGAFRFDIKQNIIEVHTEETID